MSMIARVFMSGRSQAIRLPAKLRLQATDVVIERIGNALWVQPQTRPSDNMGAWLQDFYANTEPLPSAFLEDRQDPPAQDRDWT